MVSRWGLIVKEFTRKEITYIVGEDNDLADCLWLGMEQHRAYVLIKTKKIQPQL